MNLTGWTSCVAGYQGAKDIFSVNPAIEYNALKEFKALLGSGPQNSHLVEKLGRFLSH